MREHLYDREVVNLHTHSFYCGHGVGTVADYAKEAAGRGLQVLGLSEHCPVPDDGWRRTRMAYADLPSYNRDCLAVRRLYAGRMTVLRGFECDYLDRYVPYYRDYLLGELGIDYLFFGIHDLGDGRTEETVFTDSIDRQSLHRYTDRYIEGLRSGLFAFGAHPDLFCYAYRTWDDDAEACAKAIIECAVDTKTALEVNGGGMRKRGLGSPTPLPWGYPSERFWTLASHYPVTVVTNSDAHAPEQVKPDEAVCTAFAARCGIAYCRIAVADREDGGYRLSFRRR